MNNSQNLFGFNNTNAFIIDTSDATYGFNCEIVEGKKEPVLIGIEGLADPVISDIAETSMFYAADDSDVSREKMRSFNEIVDKKVECVNRAWYLGYIHLKKELETGNVIMHPDDFQFYEDYARKLEEKYGKENLYLDYEHYSRDLSIQMDTLYWVLGYDLDCFKNSTKNV